VLSGLASRSRLPRRQRRGPSFLAFVYPEAMQGLPFPTSISQGNSCCGTVESLQGISRVTSTDCYSIVMSRLGLLRRAVCFSLRMISNGWSHLNRGFVRMVGGQCMMCLGKKEFWNQSGGCICRHPSSGRCYVQGSGEFEEMGSE
jgi:hypothetical protein